MDSKRPSRFVLIPFLTTPISSSNRSDHGPFLPRENFPVFHLFGKISLFFHSMGAVKWPEILGSQFWSPSDVQFPHIVSFKHDVPVLAPSEN